jgi:hypothetical protein
MSGTREILLRKSGVCGIDFLIAVAKHDSLALGSRRGVALETHCDRRMDFLI